MGGGTENYLGNGEKESEKSESEVAQSCPTFCDPMDCSQPGCPWYFPGKSTRVGCHGEKEGEVKDGLFLLGQMKVECKKAEC